MDQDMVQHLWIQSQTTYLDSVSNVELQPNLYNATLRKIYDIVTLL